MEGFHRAETPFSVRPGAAQQGSGASLFMHRPHRRRQPVRPPNQTAAPASLALLKHDGFNLASLYQSRCPELAHLPRVASGVCVRVRWLGCCRWCIDVGFFPFLFLAADRKHGALVACRRAREKKPGQDRGPGYARARANFRGCPNHVPMWGGGGGSGGLQWKQESKPWKLWSALPALSALKLLGTWNWDTSSGQGGHGAEASSSRSPVGHPRKRGGGSSSWKQRRR